MARAYVEIPLNGKVAAGRVALISIHRYDLVISHKWWVYEKQRSGRRPDGPYAFTTGGLRMHTLITGLSEVDHENHRTLDNRDPNLRDGVEFNDRNRRSRLNSTSDYLGVSRTYNGRWQAAIEVDGRGVFLGVFDLEEDAARARDEASRQHFGLDAFLNFPGESKPPSAPRRDARIAAQLAGPKGGSSRYKGVSFRKRTGKWEAFIRINNVLKYLGAFVREEDAGRAYDDAARKEWGANCYLNFPEPCP
jgi:hypothetical protein